MVTPLWEDKHLKIVVEESEIPWLKIFTQYPYTEMSKVPNDIKMEIFMLLDIIEKEMIAYYNPVKINIASFGNYLPHVHWHIMARFASDSYFPEPMWGTKQRKSSLKLPSFDIFIKTLLSKL